MMTVDSLNVTVTCPLCGAERKLVLDYVSYERWADGESVQDAFPYLDANEREGLITGICPDCWDKMFSNSEEDEDDSPEWHDTCDEEEEEEDYPDEYWEDLEEDWLEMDFNPYMGCYDYDC